MTHRQSKLRSRVCSFLLLLSQFSRKTLQRIWGKSLRGLLERLVEDRDKAVQEVYIYIDLYLSLVCVCVCVCVKGYNFFGMLQAALEAASSLRPLPFYNQEKDTWSVISET